MNEIIFIVDEALEGGIACSPGGQQLSLDGDLPVFHFNVTAGAEILQDNDHMGKRVGKEGFLSYGDVAIASPEKVSFT